MFKLLHFKYTEYILNLKTEKNAQIVLFEDHFNWTSPPRAHTVERLSLSVVSLPRSILFLAHQKYFRRTKTKCLIDHHHHLGSTKPTILSCKRRIPERKVQALLKALPNTFFRNIQKQLLTTIKSLFDRSPPPAVGLAARAPKRLAKRMR